MYVRARRPAPVEYRGACSCAHSEIGINDQVTWIREGQHQSLDQFDRELAGVGGLLYMIVLHVRYDPNIPGVFAEWVA